MIHNAADEKQVEKKKLEDISERDQAIADYQEILSTHAGYRFFRRFFLQNKALQVSMTGNSYTFFNEGMRNCAMKVWDEVTIADEDIAAKLFVDISKTNKEAFK